MKLKIDSPGPTGFGTWFTTDEGVPLRGIRAADITIRVDAPTTARIELVGVAVKAEQVVTAFYVPDPTTGVSKEVRRIEFADGSVWPPARGEV